MSQKTNILNKICYTYYLNDLLLNWNLNILYIVLVFDFTTLKKVTSEICYREFFSEILFWITI